MTPTHYRLELRALPGAHPAPAIRLRRALKSLRRSFGLEVVAVRELEAVELDWNEPRDEGGGNEETT